MTSIPTLPHAVPTDLTGLGFVRLEPRRRERDDGNQIWVLPWMREIFDGQTSAAGFSDYHADALNSRIIHGYWCSVSLKGDPSKKPEVERLEGLHETWSICYRKPAPGWRMFGRWFVKGLFIATDMKDRHAVASRAAYTKAAVAAVNDLSEKLPDVDYVVGNSVSDYFLGNATNVD